MFVPLCPDETVQAVYLVDSTAQDGQGPTIWRLDATDPTPSQDRTNSAFAIGEVPDGYVETEELEPGATDRRLTAWALTSSGIELIGAVDFGRVAEDELQLDLKPISADALLKSRSC